jgi:predicted DNA-binding antitoxin AbrB/MazE fold protein
MTRKVPAVYEKGLLRPLEPLTLSEGQRIIVTIETAEEPLSPDEILALAQQVYAGLSEAEITEIEAIALDRSNFMRPERESAD